MQNADIPQFGKIYSRVETVERFGREKVDLVERMLQVADPLADQAVAELFTAPHFTRADLNKGIAQGLASLPEAPPAVARLLSECEAVPEWIDASLFRQGSDIYLTVGEPWIGLALGLGGLLHTYTSPSIAKVLVATDNLSRQTERRMQETSLWRNAAVSRGGLVRGAEGYVSTVQVRVLHAHVRQGLLRKGWDAEKYGQPINQVEMFRTWLSIIAIPMMTLPKIGIEFEPAEVAVLFNMYYYIAHLIGVSPELYRLVDGVNSARAMLDLIDATTGLVTEESRALTKASIDVVANVVEVALALPAQVASDFVRELCIAFHGAELSEVLGIEKTSLSALVPVYADANRYRRGLIKADEEKVEAQIIATLDVHRRRRQLFSGKADYQ